MPYRRVHHPARWAVAGAFVAALVLVGADVWPAWAGCPLLVLLFAAIWWAPPVEEEADNRPRVPTPEEVAAQKARAKADSDARALEVVEHERVETVLKAILAREGARHDYSPPKEYGQVDIRLGTYRLAAPLPVTAADLAALNGPLTRFETATGPAGVVSLTRLLARDRYGFGIEVRTPDA